MTEDERLLVRQSKSGSVASFEKLIEDNRKKVYNVALRMLGNPEDANDAAQEVFLRAFRSMRGFKEQASFSTWIYRITKNVCLDEIRKKKKDNFVYIDKEIDIGDGQVKMQLEDDGVTPEEAAEKSELSRRVREAIAMLPEHHRMLIILRDLQNLSYEEIAEIIKCPDGTVKSRINRARSALREILHSRKELFNEGFVK